MQRPRIVVVDDNLGMLSAVTNLLNQTYSVVGYATTGAQGVVAILGLRPDVAVIDIQMPDMNGLQVAECLKDLQPETKIVFLTGLEDVDYISAASPLSPSGFVFKSRCRTDLPQAIAAALDGKVFFSSQAEAGE